MMNIFLGKEFLEQTNPDNITIYDEFENSYHSVDSCNSIHQNMMKSVSSMESMKSNDTLVSSVKNVIEEKHQGKRGAAKAITHDLNLIQHKIRNYIRLKDSEMEYLYSLSKEDMLRIIYLFNESLSSMNEMLNECGFT